MLSIAICDDEPSMVNELEARTKCFFADSGTETDIAKFYDGVSLLESCAEADYDIIFLDIRMKAPDGMETARRLRNRSFGGYLIFVTVLEDYVFDAFEVSAHDYLVKPVENDRFMRTMERLQKRFDKSCLTVQKDGESRLIGLDEIIFCEVLNRKIYVHTADGKIVDYYERIENLEKNLRSSRKFFRCHRSFLINLEHLKGFGNGLAHMKGGIDIPISRLRREAFETAVIGYMKDK